MAYIKIIPWILKVDLDDILHYFVVLWHHTTPDLTIIFGSALTGPCARLLIKIEEHGWKCLQLDLVPNDVRSIKSSPSPSRSRLIVPWTWTVGPRDQLSEAQVFANHLDHNNDRDHLDHPNHPDLEPDPDQKKCSKLWYRGSFAIFFSHFFHIWINV